MFGQEVEVKLEFLGKTSRKRVNPWKMGKFRWEDGIYREWKFRKKRA